MIEKDTAQRVKAWRADRLSDLMPPKPRRKRRLKSAGDIDRALARKYGAPRAPGGIKLELDRK